MQQENLGFLVFLGGAPHSKPPCNERVGWYALAFLMHYKDINNLKKSYSNRPKPQSKQ